MRILFSKKALPATIDEVFGTITEAFWFTNHQTCSSQINPATAVNYFCPQSVSQLAEVLSGLVRGGLLY